MTHITAVPNSAANAIHTAAKKASTADCKLSQLRVLRYDIRADKEQR